MTREEAAIDYCLFIGNTSLDEVDSFEAGAEWEHKRLVEKACEWLRNNIDFYVETNYGEDFRVDIEQLSKDIRIAMED